MFAIVDRSIRNMHDIYRYICSDYFRYYGEKPTFLAIVLNLRRNHCFAYSFWLRLASKKTPLYPLARYMHGHLSCKHGIQISSRTKIGYGLYIGHGIGIIINPDAVIGNNCNISQFLTIGSNEGTPAVIGDNVYIGPSVCLVEDVHIGDYVSIGAGAVVTKDVPEKATVVGVPAKVIHFNQPGKYIQNKFILDDTL
jgi:serine O-acetyltransferase